MSNKKIYSLLSSMFEQELQSYKFPSTLFNHLGELSATQIGEYIIDHCNVGENVAYDLAIDWIDSDLKYKQHDSSN